MVIIMVITDDDDYHGDRGDNHDHDDWESGEDSGCKDKGVDFKITLMMIDDQNQNDRDEQEAGVDRALNSYRQHHKESILLKVGVLIK